jgi:hypothetical protein
LKFFRSIQFAAKQSARSQSVHCHLILFVLPSLASVSILFHVILKYTRSYNFINLFTIFLSHIIRLINSCPIAINFTFVYAYFDFCSLCPESGHRSSLIIQRKLCCSPNALSAGDPNRRQLKAQNEHFSTELKSVIGSDVFEQFSTLCACLQVPLSNSSTSPQYAHAVSGRTNPARTSPRNRITCCVTLHTVVSKLCCSAGSGSSVGTYRGRLSGSASTCMCASDSAASFSDSRPFSPFA